MHSLRLPFRLGSSFFAGSVAVSAVLSVAQAAGPWWLEEPVALLQTNLPIHETRVASPAEMAARVAKFGANAWLLNMGGIYANYPCEMPHQMANPHLRRDEDFFGEALRAARERGVRVVARFDFSRFPPEVFAARPEWAMNPAPDGDRAQASRYNGLYDACVNGGYYQEHMFRILADAVERYPVDGVFINWFGFQPVNWYDGRPMPVCVCAGCREAWAAHAADRPLPDRADDAQYGAFMIARGAALAERLRAMLRERAPGVPLVIYHTPANTPHLDATTLEARSDFRHATEAWHYQSSATVNGFLTTHPDKAVFNTVVSFYNFLYRYAPHPPGVLATRLYQTMAHGGAPSFYVVGFLDQPNAGSIEPARAPFAWHAAHREYYGRTTNLARVAVVGSDYRQPALRGLVRMLSELHIPFAIHEGEPGEEALRDATLVIALREPTKSELRHAEGGGRLLVVGAVPVAEVFGEGFERIGEERNGGAAILVTDRTRFPGLAGTTLLPLRGSFMRHASDEAAPLHRGAPRVHAPPELVEVNRADDAAPAYLERAHGRGVVALVPWELTQLYHELDVPALRTLLDDLVTHLSPEARVIETDAPAAVEMSLRRQEHRVRDLLHLVNITASQVGSGGHAMPTGAFETRVRGEYRRVIWVRTGEVLVARIHGGMTVFTIPRVGEYELVALER